MASKVHCDVCDAVGGKDVAVKLANTPGRPAWDRARLKVTVYVTEPNHYDDTEPHGSHKDVCDDCRAKLIADAFGLRTADEYNALRDELDAARQLIPPIEPAAVDNDIPF